MVTCDSLKFMDKNITGDRIFVPRGTKLIAIVQRDNPARLNLFKAVLGGKANKSQCIKAFCLTCMGFDSIAVKECGDSCCPLWHHRPFRVKTPKPKV